MMPSTPRSSRRCISAGSSTVQTWTSISWRRAAASTEGRTIVRPRALTGTCAAWKSSAPVEMRPAAAMRRAMPRGPAPTHNEEPSRSRTRFVRRSENEHTQTRSTASRRSRASTSGSTAASLLGSRLMRVSGRSSRSSSSRRISSVPATRARRTSRHGSSAIAPRASVTRSSEPSWNATATPSAVTCTSVSTWVKPNETAWRKARRVFSGNVPAPPR